jgi:hypothetical protein
VRGVEVRRWRERLPLAVGGRGAPREARGPRRRAQIRLLAYVSIAPPPWPLQLLSDGTCVVGYGAWEAHLELKLSRKIG